MCEFLPDAHGIFLNSIINFLIVAFVIFLIVKASNAANEIQRKTNNLTQRRREEKENTDRTDFQGFQNRCQSPLLIFQSPDLKIERG
jgi:hypothetical protein